MNERDRRIARARLLRRQGKTYAEIRAALDVAVSDDALKLWLKGIPRPPETRRSCPKLDVKKECRRLRSLGYTYTEIAEATGAAAGSISLWVRDVRAPNRERGERRRLGALRAAARQRSAQQERKREVERIVATTSIGPLTDRELFLAGVALYWAEGSKSKPYDRRERVTFINSDPQVIDVFVAWLQLMGIALDECRFRVHIHETADVAAAESFWAERVGVPPEVFQRATLKKHRPLTNRLNVGDAYRGCLVISVLKSAGLYRHVEAWWYGVHSQGNRLLSPEHRMG
jgi:hypothetical protein